jgi:hypothetical protein
MLTEADVVQRRGGSAASHQLTQIDLMFRAGDTGQAQFLDVP